MTDDLPVKKIEIGVKGVANEKGAGKNPYNVRNGNVVDILKQVKDSNKNELNGILIDKLMEIAPTDTKVTIIPNLKNQEGTEIRGIYNPKRGIELNERLMTMPDQLGETIVHEVIHSALNEVIENPKTARQKELVEELDGHLERYNSFINAVYPGDKFLKYVGSNKREFVAHLNNERVQKVLSTMTTSGNRSVAHQMKDFLKELFKTMGLGDHNGDNMLTDAVNTVFNLVDTIKNKPKGLDIDGSVIKKGEHFLKDRKMAVASNKAIAKFTPPKSGRYSSSTKSYLEALKLPLTGVRNNYQIGDKVWIFGAGEWGSSMDEIEKDFNTYYKGEIDKAIEQGVKEFRIGFASGVDRRAGNYLKAKGFTTQDVVMQKDETNPVYQIYIRSVNTKDSHSIFDDNITPFEAKEAIDNKLINFLKKVNVSVQEFDNLKSLTGFDAIGVTDLLHKMILIKRGTSEQTLAKETAYVAYSLLGKKNKIRTDLLHSVDALPTYKKIYDDYKSVNPTLSDYKIKELIVVDLLADAIKNNWAVPKESYINRSPSYWSVEGNSDIARRINYHIQKIRSIFRGWLRRDKLNEEQYNELLNDVANDVLTGNMKKFNSDLTPDVQLTNYEKTIARDPIAKEIVDRVTGMGLILTGSLALRKEGTLYRDVTEDLHDLDFTAERPVMMKLLGSKINERIQIAEKLGQRLKISNELKKDIETTDLVKGIRKHYPDFKVTHMFDGLKPGDLTITGVTNNYTIDIFAMTEGESNLRSDNPMFQKWQEIFAAKIKMGRAKDMKDFANYVPFGQPDSLAKRKGLRHFNFEAENTKIRTHEILKNLRDKDVEELNNKLEKCK